MSRREAYIVDRIDRRREHEQSRLDRTARQKALHTRADALIRCEIGELPEDDRADFSEALAEAVRVQLVAFHGAPSAASILSKQSYEAGREILSGRVAKARADQLFGKVAND